MTITLTREEAQQVLDAMLKFGKPIADQIDEEVYYAAAETLRARLSAPEPEPEHVATIGNWGKVMWREGVYPQFNDKLYAAPPQLEWQGLTDQEKHKTWYEMQNTMGWYSFQEIANAIEAKLKEKNSG